MFIAANSFCAFNKALYPGCFPIPWFKTCQNLSIIFTGDFNCRSQQWWPGDIENEEGVALDEFIESNNLTQLTDQPTHIINESRSCIDLIITDQPNILVDYGVHPSLYKTSHHEITYGKINLSVPPPPSYKRKIWDYNNANIAEIRHTLTKY